MRRHEDGFTLLEMIGVVAIVLVLGSIVYVVWQQQTRDATDAAATAELASRWHEATANAAAAGTTPAAFVDQMVAAGDHESQWAYRVDDHGGVIVFDRHTDDAVDDLSAVRCVRLLIPPDAGTSFAPIGACDDMTGRLWRAANPYWFAPPEGSDADPIDNDPPDVTVDGLSMASFTVVSGPGNALAVNDACASVSWVPQPGTTACRVTPNRAELFHNGLFVAAGDPPGAPPSTGPPGVGPEAVYPAALTDTDLWLLARTIDADDPQVHQALLTQIHAEATP